MNSLLLLRGAKTAIQRSRLHTTRTSLTAVSGARSNSSSALSLPSYYSGGVDDSEFIHGVPRTAKHYDTVKAPQVDVFRASIFNTFANLTGSGALETIDKYQIEITEDGDWEDIPTTSNHLTSLLDKASATVSELSIWLISTLKRRKKMMNKHKLRKRRKKLRLKSKK